MLARDPLRRLGQGEAAMTPAVFGDLVVVRRIGDGTVRMTGVLICWYAGRVTKVDREGYVREFEYPAIGGLQKQTIGDGRGWGGGLDPKGTYVESFRHVNMDALLEAVRAHSYPGHPNQPMPFDTLEEVVALCRQFVVRPLDKPEASG
jgi:hypothetical protein